MGSLDKYVTLARLGPLNVARVGLYRVGLRLGLHPCQSITAKLPDSPFYFFDTVEGARSPLVARNDWQDGQLEFFGKSIASPAGVGRVPYWHGPEGEYREVTGTLDPWWKISDFDSTVGDIKRIWELSRFDWVLAMAQRIRLGDSSELERMNEWVSNWIAQNPPYQGRNWKCGQEASIRVLNLAMAGLILDVAEKPLPGLRELIALHLRRIAPTISYAIGQSNNHGTSEAAALFIGGSWVGGVEGKQWEAAGRRWLTNRSLQLIETDGTFSQYSVNYHRLMLDTYSFCEAWRKRFDLPPFQQGTYARLHLATDWLEQMVDAGSGDVPNLGANDGAQILGLTQCGYRDFRPSVQWASVLFRDNIAYQPGPWNQQLTWLNIELSKRMSPKPVSVSLREGGFQVLRSGSAVAYLRYPQFRFRPSQADALHCDLWIDGQNVLRDGGTYSYNVSEEDTLYFNGTVAHNTVEFDGRDQMPRYGRFLFGNWLKSSNVVDVVVDNASVTSQAGYVDYLGASHTRQMELGANKLIVNDILEAFACKAILRWRLLPGEWQVEGHTIQNDNVSINISSTVTINRFEMKVGYESRYYLEKTEVPVLEVELIEPGILTTTVTIST